MQGISLTESVYRVCIKHDVKREEVEIECCKWLQLLVKFVNFTDDGARDHLQLFFKNDQVKVLTMKKQQEIVMEHVSLILMHFCNYHLHNHVILQICTMTRMFLSEMSIEQFESLFVSIRIYPHHFLKRYLKDCKFPLEAKINDHLWMELLKKAVFHYPGAKNQGFLIKFIEKVLMSYAESKRQRQIVIHLLDLKIPQMFAVECSATQTDDYVTENFRCLLKSYVHDHQLQTSIVSNITSMMVSTIKYC